MGGFAHVYVSSLNRHLSRLVANPSSSGPNTHETGLDAYRESGGNCIYLHGEGGETHSREATARWLRDRGLRNEFFLCTQICHDDWDAIHSRPIDRFTSHAVAEDVTKDLSLMGIDHLDLVCLGDNPASSFEPVFDALTREIQKGRIGAYGLSNWTPRRIEQAIAFAHRQNIPPPAAVFTTELALARASEPMWPEYPPFDGELEKLVERGGLTVFAHVGDVNLGQCLYGDEDSMARFRPNWVSRWQHPANSALTERVRTFAAQRGLTCREVNLAYVLNQSFAVLGILGLPSILDDQREQYLRASGLALEKKELDLLKSGSGSQRAT